MTTPCVLYVQRVQFGRRTSIEFRGTTSRKEAIYGRISWKFECDPVGVLLSIDDVLIKAPDDLDFDSADAWIIQQVEDLGYHVITFQERDLITV